MGPGQGRPPSAVTRARCAQRTLRARGGAPWAGPHPFSSPHFAVRPIWPPLEPPDPDKGRCQDLSPECLYRGWDGGGASVGALVAAWVRGHPRGAGGQARSRCVPGRGGRRKKRRAKDELPQDIRSHGRRRVSPRGPEAWSHQPSWRGQTRAASSCRRCPPAFKPRGLPPRPPSPAVPPRQGPSQLLWLRCHRSSFGQGQEGASKTGGRPGGTSYWGPHTQGAAEPELNSDTKDVPLRNPVVMPRCPLGQPAGPKGCIISLPQPHPHHPRGRARQAPALAELLTYSARWLCTACPGPSS